MVEKELTRAEEQIMKVMWQLDKCFVKDIIEQLPDPKPAYNTVSTIVRILETKGFVDHKAYGKTHEYFPIITKEQYSSFATEKLVEGYFENSFSSLFSFFSQKGKIDVKEADEILKMINEMKAE
ncbi:Predicted transcriptional regulator [Pseudarcicella hirudinis]|uniref:Predicted transcriptional regulator n=1 Tax=Pseudarcicella hirudinis TaxID=1079859 RepID=A0A1I5YFR8_9BACT|nr:BlaI/MecI/CopY family transcriptional regulator [Pseudarcicella hirudinis]SFQ43003.1 Predicted transcriptional regulator [Pseudarcicella hirudinis]